MYKVTKHIDFCYGHRLLNYSGMCQHLHGHNARVEVDIESDRLDARGMVYDFADIKETIKAWIDDTLDHNMLLNQADPVVPLLQQRGERLFLMNENPTAESIAKLIYGYRDVEAFFSFVYSVYLVQHFQRKIQDEHI